ncbi:MAG: pyruvate carboxyltransferase [Proteobacteria bacterium]|nr:pyruvate carboxyltransferase [Pseudomonadota bacterium]MBU0968620.1 pyruvate carboxyltransferase [Pseudomonadota bacterium]
MKGLIDSTLREGEQAPGVFFPLAVKIKIAKLLARIGIEEIELGIATPYDQELPLLMRILRRRSSSSSLALWCRCVVADIDFAAALAPDVLSLSIPASDLHIYEKLGRNRNWIKETLAQAIRHSLAQGITSVSVGLEDATRADEDFLAQLIQTAEQAGAARVRLADTVGIASPGTIAGLVRRIARISTLEIGIHAHNDFGMATANAIAALEAGADWADATVLGIGERAGNSRLEEMAGYLALRGDRRPYKTEHLRPLCLTVAHAAARQIPGSHPLVGDEIFTCETGLHLQGLTRNPATYEPYDPERVGGERRLLLGRKSGKRAIQDRLHALGCSLPEERLEQVVHLVRREAGSKRRPLNDEEIRTIIGV